LVVFFKSSNVYRIVPSMSKISILYFFIFFISIIQKRLTCQSGISGVLLIFFIA